MKLINVLTHSVLLAISFSFIVISGEKFSWFYVIILLIGITQFYIHAILGLTGILFLLILPSFNVSKLRTHCLNLFGGLLIFLSLFSFFENDTSKYNWPTFSDPISRFTLVLFGILWTVFVIKHTTGLAKLLFKGNAKTITV